MVLVCSYEGFDRVGAGINPLCFVVAREVAGGEGWKMENPVLKLCVTGHKRHELKARNVIYYWHL